MTEPFSILLVDDDPTIADLLNQAARQVFPALVIQPVKSFDEAVAFFETLDGPGPKLILLDLDLNSSQNGYDFLQLMRTHSQGKYIPIIILSHSQELSKMEDAYRQGATAFTIKPFTFSEWKVYVHQLRTYWFEMAALPIIWFGDQKNSFRRRR